MSSLTRRKSENQRKNKPRNSRPLRSTVQGNRPRKYARICQNLWIGTTTVIAVWLIVSWIQVILHNFVGVPYPVWNAFVILVAFAK